MAISSAQDLDLSALLAEISAKKSIIEILRFLRPICFDLGADRLSYHLAPKLHSQIDRSVQLVTDGFSSKLLELYQDANFRKNDPIPDTIMKQGEPMLWSDAIAASAPNEEQYEFLMQCKALGLKEGIGMPLFGPKGRNGYAAFTFVQDSMLSDAYLISTMSALSNAAHQRICLSLDHEKKSEVQLSTRESQVMQLIANGRSNKAIANILDIGRSTADTYVRRVFAKLEVSDRIGASIKALKLGILQL